MCEVIGNIFAVVLVAIIYCMLLVLTLSPFIWSGKISEQEEKDGL